MSDEPMTDKPDGKQRGTAIRWISGLLAVYVLSIGPMDRIVGDSTLGQLALMIVYYPLIMLGTAFRPFADLLSWYSHLFG
jgi:hypothetical protein